jgi:hypothetical protein
VTCFAFKGRLEKFRGFLVENAISREMIVKKVESVDVNEVGMRIGIR